ncbi:hypothetical protein NP493_158g02010 [Ridgeia piscesae]|uniref:UspA domain-containing protein n=1 Tax=Ridgeia piscesae TaxID=27915 RepID=A0AAD9UFK6_RIDPI|nr:hypothetical protein NP493_158g02010 [Ridgeia piscesae]
MSATDGASSAVTAVIAIDGSQQSEQAFYWYVKNVHKEGNNVVLVHGQELPPMPTRDSWDQQMQAGKKKRDEIQGKYMEKFQQCGIKGKFISDFEKPGEFICETAKKENASYVVMGTRGLGKIRRTIMGSVSDYVVHHATCPVLVCRNAEKTSAAT